MIIGTEVSKQEQEHGTNDEQSQKEYGIEFRNCRKKNTSIRNDKI
jgi:hypothetical protein